jgi:hypothetical protein
LTYGSQLITLPSKLLTGQTSLEMSLVIFAEMVEPRKTTLSILSEKQQSAYNLTISADAIVITTIKLIPIDYLPSANVRAHSL